MHRPGWSLGATGPALALSLLQGPRPRAVATRAKLKKSQKGNGLGPRGSGALPVAGQPQELWLALGLKDLLVGENLWGKRLPGE